MSREFGTRLPEKPISVPIRKPNVKIIPRVETLDVLPGIKMEDLNKHYNLFTAEGKVKIEPEDDPEKLWTFFTTQVVPDIATHRSGNLRYPDMAQYLSDEFVRHIHLDTRYLSKFLDDPSLLGSSIYNQYNMDKGRKFNTTERGFIDLDNSLQGIAIIGKTNVENLSKFAKSTNLEFLMLKERMQNFEDLLIFFDASMSKMFQMNKAMQVSIMKATLESQATGFRCAEVLTLAANALIKKDHESFTKEEVAELLFKAKKTDVSEDLARDSVLNFPTDEEFLDSAIQRINELSIDDVESKDDSIEMVKDVPRVSRNLRQDYSPVKEFLESRREPIVSPPVDHAHVTNKLAEMRKNRFPAVNAPILQLTLKSTMAQINQAFQESVGHTGPERRTCVNKPPKRAPMPPIPEAPAPPLPDTDQPMASPPKTPPAPPPSPDNALKLKHKLQTARKSTAKASKTPRKRSKSLESVQGVEIGTSSNIDELDETLSEIDISDEEIQCLAVIKKPELENCVVKQELQEKSSNSDES